MPFLKLLAFIFAFSVAAPSQAATDQVPAAPSTAGSAAAVTGISQGDEARQASELQALRQALPAKKQELARLHRKYLVAKGRVPSEKEKEEFEKKRAKGQTTFADNPYVNKNPLSTPGPARVAYYGKLEEVKRDEARIRQLEQELGK